MKKRLNIQIEVEVDDYIQSQADMLGISKNGFINVVIAQYRQQNEVVNQIPTMMEMFQKMQSMAKLKGDKQ